MLPENNKGFGRRPNMQLSRRTLMAAIPSLGMVSLADPAHAQLRPEPKTGTRLVPEEERSLEAWVDEWGRPTAKVTINGQGPFRFLVDTGSTTTVIAQRIATQLAAPITGTAVVNGTTGSAEMPVARLDKLETGVVTSDAIRVAILSDEGLGREDGILGADVFSNRRLTFDIEAKSVRVEPTRRGVKSNPVANMRIRNGLLAEVDGKIGGVYCKLMLDTGAQNCIVNPVLEASLVRAQPKMQRYERAKVIGVTGHVLEGNYLRLPRIDFGKIYVRDAGAVATNAHIFRLWNLTDEPAMIVGVDVLSRLAGFSIDYGAKMFDAEPMAGLIAKGSTMLG
jgi:predicted aspartyl protease